MCVRARGCTVRESGYNRIVYLGHELLEGKVREREGLKEERKRGREEERKRERESERDIVICVQRGTEWVIMSV